MALHWRYETRAIIGRGASGKSTLAVRLDEITGLPLIELDKVVWQPGLVARTRDHWIAIQERLVAEEGWIIDGSSARTENSFRTEQP